jgi:hypothetical protein
MRIIRRVAATMLTTAALAGTGLGLSALTAAPAPNAATAIEYGISHPSNPTAVEYATVQRGSNVTALEYGL